ncbi:uncharacterized protein B0I36DRAFT_331126 [Microdochium trichocladiopsis]|uniref:Uncharacterized protein n=1 Tax=Microdochium trichocladiopsis TaxID=1682393 RepID=A0A9P8Y0T3_9PEZI|nr:uncharacterized protein B0I36DRAFT_331126 [Microdochium trichocladiopsis]KAH7026672.1 hypothetical protein B0I36DRAFT_331126 [Microdochium trichocladiopsis]
MRPCAHYFRTDERSASSCPLTPISQLHHYGAVWNDEAASAFSPSHDLPYCAFSRIQISQPKTRTLPKPLPRRYDDPYEFSRASYDIYDAAVLTPHLICSFWILCFMLHLCFSLYHRKLATSFFTSFDIPVSQCACVIYPLSFLASLSIEFTSRHEVIYKGCNQRVFAVIIPRYNWVLFIVTTMWYLWLLFHQLLSSCRLKLDVCTRDTHPGARYEQACREVKRGSEDDPDRPCLLVCTALY